MMRTWICNNCFIGSLSTLFGVENKYLYIIQDIDRPRFLVLVIYHNLKHQHIYINSNSLGMVQTELAFCC